MKNLKYFIQFILIIISFLIFKILGPNMSSKLSGKIFEIIDLFLDLKKSLIQILKKLFQIYLKKKYQILII